MANLISKYTYRYTYSYTYKYTLIKDELGAAILNFSYVVWMLGLVIMAIGIIR